MLTRIIKASRSLLLILLVATSCVKQMGPKDYIRHIRKPENGVNKIIVTSVWNWNFQYMTPIYMNLLEGINPDSTGNRKGYVSMVIKFNKAGATQSPLRQDISGYEEYQSRINYYSTEAVKDIKVMYGNKQVGISNYHFETNYNVSPQEAMVFNFKLPDDDYPNQDIEISYYDRVFKNGIIKATFKRTDLQNANNIKINFN